MSRRQFPRLNRFVWSGALALVCLSVIACSPLFGASPRPPLVGTPALDPAPAATGVAEPTLPGWRLVWNDEFDGNAVNTDRWTVVSSLPGGYLGCCLNYGNASWAPDHVTVSDGQLHLISTNDPLEGKPYTSGAVTTALTYSLTYGRIDIRAQLPRTPGLWPAFWLLPVNGDSQSYAPYEIDMLEAWGADTHQVFAYFHWHSYQIQCEASGPDYAAGFHVYTLIWTAGKMQWAVDGVTQCATTAHVPQEPLFLNMSVAVGGKNQATNGATILPQTMNISYVRVWQPA